VPTIAFSVLNLFMYIGIWQLSIGET